MADQTRPGDLPPDLPEEHAEAYERGYRRALFGGFEGEPTARLDARFEDESPRPGRRRRRSHGWLVPGLLAVMVVGLLASAYLLGRMFSSEVAATDVAEETPHGVALSDDDGTPDGPDAKDGKGADHSADGQSRGQPYRGPVQSVPVGFVEASCQYPSSVDAAGNKVSYPPAQVRDDDLSTAWRCAGDGIGERLTLTLEGEQRIAEVGLVPGYAKTDPRTGADRYAENNRITEVRWILGGEEFVQRLDGSPESRDLQTMRIPATRTDTVVIEVLASVGGPRNTVAVSELRLAAATD